MFGRCFEGDKKYVGGFLRVTVIWRRFECDEKYLGVVSRVTKSIWEVF